MLHLAGLALGMGGLLAQLILLGKFQGSSDIHDRVASERMAASVISLVQKPGVYLSLITGLALVWMMDWAPIRLGWLQFKLLFVFWIVLATTLMSRNAKSIHALREQCGNEDSQRLHSLKDNHRMIGYVTVLTFFFVIIFSLWKPF